MRIAASTYLNSAPLVWSFYRGSLKTSYSFLGDTSPSRCAEMLGRRECEIALIPVIEYQRIPGLQVIPEVAVASKRQVRSVIIAARKPLESAKVVVLDSSSCTSQALVKILFERKIGHMPEFSERTPSIESGYENMLDSCDAALIIGDPAMKIASSSGRLGIKIYDLAEEWNKMTGLPFVFAVWAVREEAVKDTEELVRDFIFAREEGRKNIELIATEFAAGLGLEKSDLLDYLSENVNYNLDEANIAGLNKYFSLAYECGLIDRIRELKFTGR